MKMLRKVMLISVAVLSTNVMAESWNDEVVNEIKRLWESGDKKSAFRLLEAESSVDSIRATKSEVRIIERKKYLELAQQAGLPGLPDNNVSEYEAIVDVPVNLGNKVEVRKVLVPVSPDEVEKMKAEAAGASREELGQLFKAMSAGLLVTGEGLRKEIKESGWGGILSSDGYFETTVKMMPGKDFTEKCRFIMLAGEESSGDNKDEMEAMLFGINTREFKFDPGLMMLGPACMTAVLGQDFEKSNGDMATHEEIKGVAANAVWMKGWGTSLDKIDNVLTNRISAKNLSLKQKTEDGKEVIIESVDVWIDPEYFKRRKLRFEGTMIENGKPRKFFMERKNSDYRRVGNSYMYEPYKEELTFGGMIDEKQRKELAQAQKELAKFEKELAAMPASQRKMMESMMGSQMEQLRKMVDSGAATITILTKDIIINPDLGDKGVMYTVLSEKGSKSTPSDYIGMMTGGALVQLIQQNLTKLGYQPGAATGELSDETRAAISKYQKDKGLAVTGNASAELARQTQNEVEALSL